jgi:hypothetical protein
MTDDNSFLLPYRLTPLATDYGPYMRGATWADPDLDAAARLMRLVVESPEQARARGARARDEVSRDRAPGATGAEVRKRLTAIQTSPADGA